jgi:hypothetical protein
MKANAIGIACDPQVFQNRDPFLASLIGIVRGVQGVGH